jgi:hypothetical protein
MNEELIAYYENLLILQYRDKDKARRTIRAIVESAMIYDLIRAVENGYDIDTAVGVQLDVIGKYVGVDRVVTGIAFDRVFFGSVEYSEPTPYVDVEGSIRYSEVNPPDAQILRYDTDEQSLYTLTDQELRDLIRLKIGQNSINHSPGSIDDIIQEFFAGDAIFTDNLNMTISYIFDEGVQRLVQIAVSQNVLPKPMAVGITTSFVPDIDNIFGSIGYNAETIPDFIHGSQRYTEDFFGSSLRY